MTNRYGIVETENAKWAFEKVKSVSNETYSGKYKSYIKKMPMLIKVNGLAATLAFILSKSGEDNDDKRAYKKIGDQIIEFFNTNNNWKYTEMKEVIEKIVSLNSLEYRENVEKINNILYWMKRFVDGLIKKEGD
ncbi:MAG: type III-B CRISPR module-associated protein Cmr5 [candidate division WOR-3 bacterium]